MKELIINEDNYKKTFKEILSSKEDVFWYGICKKPIVILGTYDKGNKEEAIRLGYDYGENTYTRSGTFLLNKGDIQIGIMRYDWNTYEMKKFQNNFIEFLISKGLNAKVAGNDIMVNNEKIAGTSHQVYDNRKIFLFEISMFEPNLEHIKAVCNKPMLKIPAGLTKYGINSNEIIDLFRNMAKGVD